MSTTNDASALGAFTIREFCAEYGISRSKLYLLWAEGEGPTVLKIGSRTLISYAAAEGWQRSLERRFCEHTNGGSRAGAGT